MKIKLLVFFLIAVSLQTFGQKFGYVNTDFILSKMPEYQQAQLKIDDLSSAWQKEIIDMSKEIAALYDNLKAEEVLLTPEMKEERMNEIKKKESELKEQQKKIFGFEGLLFLKKKELIKPVMDKVWDAVEVVSKEHKLAIVFDKSADIVMIYTDPRHDYTDFVLEELGLGDPNDVIK